MFKFTEESCSVMQDGTHCLQKMQASLNLQSISRHLVLNYASRLFVCKKKKKKKEK